ncbi:hypothetical protein CSC70_08675 [Pseudoxanthomonas kalamensis DSM 18571]|uniref:hypothetical protein n=1 Tax=Pseudoxanthomonas kalamensis TaxID=289483 RepID=UPI001390CF8A|nr:hypothetical protein [Pseudoxanthomonas kalamensis]KAF1709762.1 hypothetical protein CSC70_08675 [Pseudoxanthomonas kalamensis DSM 18571]
MPTCRVRYTFTTTSSRQHADPPGFCTGLAEEIREPDDAGQPGRLVSRYWLRAIAEDGQDIAERLNSGYFRISSLDLIGTLAWDTVEP